MKKKTLIELLLRSYKNFDNDCGIIFTKKGDEYASISRNELLSNVIQFVNYFKTLELKSHDKIAIISENRNEWVITDLACILSGLVLVPLYVSLSSESIKYILKDSCSVVCFVSGELQLEKVISVRNDLPDLKQIICFNETKKKFEDVVYLRQVLDSANGIKQDGIENFIRNSSENISEEDLVTIIYTSGTTGIPKGVMLTHKNMCSNLLACMKVLQITEKDIFLSYLPYSHSYERTAGYYLAFFSGSKIYYAQSIDTIAVQMQEVKPTIVITVPRLLDRMYNRLMKRRDELPEGYRKNLFNWGIDMAMNQDRRKFSIKWFLADILVFKKIRERTGGRIRFFVSGGGALNKNIGEFLDRIGIQTFEGYGLTETSPVISVNRPDRNKYGTVGPPLDGVEVKTMPDGEIIVKGDLVMKGYYKDEAETNKTIKNGWLYTGDIGKIDKDGYIKITDRKKSLFKSSGGKYIAPAQIEDLVQQIPYIDQVLVIGNERMYVTALIVPELNELKNLSKQLRVTLDDIKELLKSRELLKKIEDDINNLQRHLSQYQKVRKFTLLEKPFSIEDGELTPTMKIKRKFVEEKYKDLIEKMYPKV
ncbi:MAG: long-chain fatty acid--CoA ligase [Bacteroidetes bacterium]|nr:long-chain fatty acid--CoA ligase [Bacteroidota bacterium]